MKATFKISSGRQKEKRDDDATDNTNNLDARKSGMQEENISGQDLSWPVKV